MKIKPSKPFVAAVDGEAYPTQFTKDDEFEANSDAARTALVLGCLSEKDAAIVRKAQDVNSKPKGKTKNQGAAPENKAGGVRG